MLFHEFNQIKYAFLLLYMIWFMQINIAEKLLQSIILINKLVNLYDIKNSWFKINKFNKFNKFQMKTFIITWKTFIIDCADLFHYIVLIRSYYTDLKIIMKAAFEKHNNDQYQIKNANQKMHYLTY